MSMLRQNRALSLERKHREVLIKLRKCLKSDRKLGRSEREALQSNQQKRHRSGFWSSVLSDILVFDVVAAGLDAEA